MGNGGRMAEIIHPPVLAFGYDSQDATTSSLGDDTNSVAVVNTGSPRPFPVGGIAFVATAAGTAMQCLGPILTANDAGITTLYYTNSAKGAAALVWTAEEVVSMSRDYLEPYEGRALPWDILILKSGLPRKVQNRDSRTQLELRWANLDNEDWRNVRDFLMDERDEGLFDFNLAYWSRPSATAAGSNSGEGKSVVAQVTMNTNRFDFRESQRGTVPLILPLDQIALDSWVAS